MDQQDSGVNRSSKGKDGSRLEGFPDSAPHKIQHFDILLDELSEDDKERWLRLCRDVCYRDKICPPGVTVTVDDYRTVPQRATAALWAFVKRYKTTVSALVMIAVMGPLFGFNLIVALILMLVLHEAGHIYVLWRLKVPFSTPVFIPFIGAAITTSEIGNLWDEAMVGLGGPLLGTVTSLLALLLGMHLDSDFIFLAGAVGAWVNLFNLIPIVPLDGGRALRGVSRWFAPLGLILMGWWSYRNTRILLGLITLLLVKSVWRGFRGADTRPKLRWTQKGALVGIYLLLLCTLLALVFGTEILAALEG